MATSSWGT
uniref:Uncharacterized protein n=1 Tax=Arundo donax TaxID=35708 RepID=A0A0A9FWX1_ARUDO